MNILKNGRINLELLHSLEEKPALFAPGDITIWTDPYISEHILDAHLDPDSDDASRREETIDEVVDFITRRYPPGEFSRLLDLGCGPGLYASRLHEAGYRVTGMDFSEVSISWARDEAEEYGRDIQYLQQDYRTWQPDEKSYDIILLIFGDFCVLSPEDRGLLLENVRQALVPGGVFLFDVFTEMYLPHPDERAWFTMLEDGFWRPDHNLVFEIKHRYPEDSVHLNRYLIVTEDGRVRTCNIWHRWFSRREIRELMEKSGFKVEKMWADLKGTTLKPSPEWIGIEARVARAR